MENKPMQIIITVENEKMKKQILEIATEPDQTEED